MTLPILPSDILYKIVNELPATDRARLAQVDTRLAGAQSDPRFWEDLLPTFRAAQLNEIAKISSGLASIVAAQLRLRLTTVAGTGDKGFNGDNQPASTAHLDEPSGVAVDVYGNLFIADTYNKRVRKVDTQGTITTVAGTGSTGFDDDTRLATAARLAAPWGVAVDVYGNLFIADTYNKRVRKVDTHGTITTVAGTGEAGFNGDNQPATTAHLASPRGMAVDGYGNFYIADTYNNRVRKVDGNGVITTVAGTGQEGFNGDDQLATVAHLASPRGVAVDAHGTLCIADTDNDRVRKVDGNGVITTVAGTGEAAGQRVIDGEPLSMTPLRRPEFLAFDSQGNLYIADTHAHRVRRVLPHQ
ncbi:hypothetical protein AB0885_43780 [Streptomyces sp. NPDC005534]|uniref:NHL domain-containing protein n=1 Tax=Streptomyces sp. NPDC005534 TaxID=3155714 RepID=UPI0034569BEA